MPYISVVLAKKLSESEIDLLKSELGKLISIIPGKSENGLMVNIESGGNMYMRGEKADAAFIDIRLFREAPLEAKQNLTSAIFDMLYINFAIEKSNIYLVYNEYQNWGLKGSLL